MRNLIAFLAILWNVALVGYETDFDTIFIGSSPISMLEALYRTQCGERVLIIEEADQCGGAWKSISICGVPYADLGCHHIGADKNLKCFLEEYVGCKMVSLDCPTTSYSGEASQGTNGFYFSKGCHELMDNIKHLITAHNVMMVLGSKVEQVFIDEEKKIVEVNTANIQTTSSKLVVTPSTYLCLGGSPSNKVPSANKVKYYHVYLLIQDETPPRFSYKYGAGKGISRMMNLTHFSDLADTGLQLIAIQTHNDYYLSHPEEFFSYLKTNKLVKEDAELVCAENCIYEQSHLDTSLVAPYKSSMIEVLNTGHFLSMSNYITKWKQVLKPFEEAIAQ